MVKLIYCESLIHIHFFFHYGALANSPRNLIRILVSNMYSLCFNEHTILTS